MNNSLPFEVEAVSAGNPTDLERLREREVKLVKLIEALGALQKSKEWSTLREELFDHAIESLERRQQTEAEKPEVDLPALYRLQGQKLWARRYDFPSMLDTWRAELANIRKQLNPPNSEGNR